MPLDRRVGRIVSLMDKLDRRDDDLVERRKASAATSKRLGFLVMPKGREGCYAALTWLVEHAAELDVDTLGRGLRELCPPHPRHPRSTEPTACSGHPLWVFGGE